jgi:hypothetical protein
MALNFPLQPQTPGTPYEAPNGVTYIWDGVKWNASGTPGTGNSNLGNLYVIDQTIAGLNETDRIFITGTVEVGNLATAGFSIGETEITVLDGNLYLDGTAVGQDNNFDQSLNTTDDVMFANVSAGNVSAGNVSVDSNLTINGTELTTEAGTLYVDGIAVGGAGFASELVAGDYNVTLYPNGNTVIPGTISSTAAGIPEFNSSTDLNLTAVNRVNIVNSPLNLGSVLPSNIIGKPGDIIYHPDLKEIQAYINGAWENLLRTAENQNVRLPQGGAFQRADGVRAAWFTELPSDISQLTDNNNLLTTQSITLQNIDIDGGGAYSIYETGLMFADGGFGSSRFGPSDTVFDGADAGGGYTNSLNGGFA